MRYVYHQRFFALLAEHLEGEAATLVLGLSSLFGQIWSLCQKRASALELEDHFPTVLGLTEALLVEEFTSWEREQRVFFLRALQQTLTQEADGDFTRGRTRLAALLYETAKQVGLAAQQY